jgi:molybdopterin converting factor small subunit
MARAGRYDRGRVVKLLFYGRLADVIGTELELEAPPGCSVGELRELLISEHPDAGPVLRSARSRACIGDALVGEEHVPAAGERVEFLPPVSGG